MMMIMPSNELAVAAVTPSSTSIAPKHLLDHCICKWIGCRAMQQAFTACMIEGENELCGRRAIQLNFAGVNPQKIVWRKAVLSNLGTSEDNIHDIAKVPVARHNWSYAQLKYFENNHHVRTPVALATMKEIANPLDKEDRIKKEMNCFTSIHQTTLMTS
jgi:hypothetical protein